MEEQAPYIVNGKPSTRREVLLAAERLKQFCKQFGEMTEEEKKYCIEKTDAIIPRLLAELHNALDEYMK